MNREQSTNPFAPPALVADDGLLLEDGLRMELTPRTLSQAASRCAMQMHSVFSLSMFVIACAFTLLLAASLASRYFFVYWAVTLIAAFFIQNWFSKPVRERIMNNTESEPSLAPGQKRIALRDGVIYVEYKEQQRQFRLSETRIWSDGDPAAWNRNAGMSSIVLEVAKDTILVVPGNAFPSSRGYRDYLKLLKRKIAEAKRAASLVGNGKQ